jgi:hypothetical protein
MALKLNELKDSGHSNKEKGSSAKTFTVKPWQNIPKEPDLLEEILKHELSGKYKIKKSNSLSSNKSKPLQAPMTKNPQINSKIQQIARQFFDELNPE